MTTPKTNLDIVRAMGQAYVNKDRASIEALIADNFHFTSPLDNRIDRATYFERCWPTSKNAVNYEYIHLYDSGKHVFVTYEGERDNGDRFRNTEVITIENNQVTNVEVYFGWNVPHEAEQGGFINPS